MNGGAWWAAVHGVAKSRARLSDFIFSFHLHALEKEMATHSSILAWRIPGMGEPGGLLSMVLRRVRHNWSDLAAAAAANQPPAIAGVQKLALSASPELEVPENLHLQEEPPQRIAQWGSMKTWVLQPKSWVTSRLIHTPELPSANKLDTLRLGQVSSLLLFLLFPALCPPPS